MNKYIVIQGKDYDNPQEIMANFVVIDNDTKHLLFYVEDPTSDPKGYIVALNFYTWTIIGENDNIRVNPYTYITE